MFRRIEDFVRVWSQESELTLRILGALTEASLAQTVAPGGRTLGRLAWHVVQSACSLGRDPGLGLPAPPAKDAPPPALPEMIRLYQANARALAEAVGGRWTDAMLEETVPMYGEQWPRGKALWALITHQAHHRAQMTVLMRQAGLRVPGVYGPAAEEWAAMGMASQA